MAFDIGWRCMGTNHLVTDHAVADEVKEFDVGGLLHLATLGLESFDAVQDLSIVIECSVNDERSLWSSLRLHRLA